VISFALKLLPWAKIAGIAAVGVAAAAGWLYVSVLRADLRAATAERDGAQAALKSAVEVNLENIRSLDALQAENLRLTKVAAAAEKKARARAVEAARLQEAIRHAPPTDDAPVAPILRFSLDRLFQLYASGDGHADSNGEGRRP